MKRVLIIVLAVAAVLTLAACASGSTDTPSQNAAAQNSTESAPSAAAGSAGVYAGEWMDYISKRAYANITPDGDKFDVTVHWGGSAWESTEWSMHAEYDEIENVIYYTDGKKQIVTYPEEGGDPSFEVLFEGSSGSFRYNGVDRIAWNDDKDPEVAENMIFLSSALDKTPADLLMIGYYFIESDGSEMEITHNFDDSFNVNISITRLAGFEGLGIYDEEKGTLEINALDPNGEPIAFSAVKADDGSIKLTVTESDWGLLENGTVFDFA